MIERVLTPDRPHQSSEAEAPTDRGAARTLALSVAWVVWATFAQLVRGPATRAPDAIWAEDAAFLNHAIHRTAWENLLTPHAGYVQVVCRLLSDAVALLPPSWMAVGIAAGASVVVSLLSLVVWFASASVLSSPWARMTVTALVPLLPQASFEVNATGANLHWFLAYAAFWVLLAAPTSIRGQVVGSLVVLVAALSDPLTALVLPAAVLGAFVRRRRSFIVPSVMVVGLVVQGAVRLGQPPLQWVKSDPHQLPWIYGLRVLTSSAIGDRELGLFYDTFGLTGVLVVSAVLATLFLKILSLVNRETRLVALLAATTSVAYLCIPLALRGNEGYLDHGPLFLSGSRYTIVPLMFLWLAVIAVVDKVLTQRGQPHAFRLAPIAITALLSLQLVASVGGETVRSHSPSWEDDVRRAAETCTQAPPTTEPQPRLAFADHPGPGEVQIVVAPSGLAIPWGVVMPCDRLR
ncbi:glucosyltransferase [Saccharopolyspora karakumensis]|uniref:Glucosyltransferase n=1 Tax=Saccharopolyspora karakumensis TaxID=2530386 RepID=A0A4R5BRN5_9PSEU|nr:glucosyltransferase [Saccharopolyspora karakumensis]TDD88113.1 glucosyltransferase [Saccharopolyspora karakumensis]